MKIENPEYLPKEAENKTQKDDFIEKRDAFQTSEHYSFVMSVIDECLNNSSVKELIASKNGAVDEAELGRLTLVEWLAEKKINKEIKERLSYGR